GTLDRGDAGGGDDLADAAAPGALEHVERAEQVHVEGERGVDLGLAGEDRGEMDDAVDAVQCVEDGLAVGDVEPEHVALQVGEDDLVTGLFEEARKPRSDEAGAAGDKSSRHAITLALSQMERGLVTSRPS